MPCSPADMTAHASEAEILPSRSGMIWTHSRGDVPSTLVESHNGSPGQRIEMELKSDDGRRRVSRHLQTLDPDRKDREQITMRVIARRRTRTAIAGSTEIGSGLQRTLRQHRTLRIAGAHVKLRHAGRNVHHQPVPKPAARGRIRIETSDREALRPGGCSLPGQMRRLIVALAAKAKIGGRNVGVGEIIAIAETIAPDRECHTRLLLWSSRKPRLCQIDVACSREAYAAVVA